MAFLIASLIMPVYLDISKRDWSCDKKAADIVFLLDTSASMWEQDFDKQVVFVEHIVNHLPVSERGVHVAVSSFGSDVSTHVFLNSYFDKNNLIDAISTIQYRGGRTKTQSAIRHARKVLFNTKHGGRDGVEQILIVITDGRSTDLVETAFEASMCRSLGMKLISVGVGHDVDEFELSYIASEHNGEKIVFSVDNFDSLYSVEDLITTTTCDVIQTEDSIMADAAVQENPTESQVRKYCGGKPADVYFVVDSSSSVRSTDYEKMLGFITEVIALFDLSPQMTRVGVVAYSDGIHPVITLDNDFGEDVLKQRIKDIQHYKGGTRTGSVLQYLRQQGFKRGYARENAAHVVILLTDGYSADASLTLQESKILKQMGTYIFAVGIGDQVDIHELQTVSSQPHDNFVFLMEDFNVLSAIKNVLAIKTCLDTTQVFPADSKNKVNQLQADSDYTDCSPGAPLDVLYVYDSYYIGKEHSELLENFISDMIISTTDSDIYAGLVSGACERPIEAPLEAYKDFGEIKPLLRRSQAEGIADLLKHVRIHGFTEKNGGRNGAKKKVILFIDGETKDVHSKMRLAVKRLKFRSDVDIVVVFMGKEPGRVVTSLVDNPVTEHLLQTDSVDTLHSVKHAFMQIMCKS